MSEIRFHGVKRPVHLSNREKTLTIYGGLCYSPPEEIIGSLMGNRSPGFLSIRMEYFLGPSQSTLGNLIHLQRTVVAGEVTLGLRGSM